MQIADEYIQEFVALYKKHYGTNLTNKEARVQGLRLIQLFEAIRKSYAQSNGFKKLKV